MHVFKHMFPRGVKGRLLQLLLADGVLVSGVAAPFDDVLRHERIRDTLVILPDGGPQHSC